jgi:hypothetical protein
LPATTDIAKTTVANLGRVIFLFRYFDFLFRYFDAIVADISEVAKDVTGFGFFDFQLTTRPRWGTCVED